MARGRACVPFLSVLGWSPPTVSGCQPRGGEHEQAAATREHPGRLGSDRLVHARRVRGGDSAISASRTGSPTMPRATTYADHVENRALSGAPGPRGSRGLTGPASQRVSLFQCRLRRRHPALAAVGVQIARRRAPEHRRVSPRPRSSAPLGLRSGGHAVSNRRQRGQRPSRHQLRRATRRNMTGGSQ
jgi:hypothetical protein